MHKQQRRQEKGDTTFDVCMSSYDVAEAYKQLGSFLLSQLQNRNLPRRRIGHFKHHTERYRKHQKGNMPHLQSQWATDHHRSQRKDHFLEVTFNLNKSTYQPFTKPNTTLKYVHHERNHPPTTTKNIPAGINERLSSLSSDKAFFDQATSPYQKHLKNADTGILYTTSHLATTNKRKNRQLNNILWYNLLFSKNVSTNIRPDSLT